MNSRECANGRWVPAIPLKAPIDMRLKCRHEWTEHVHDEGWTSHLDWDCLRCGTTTENAARPRDGRSWLGRLFYGS